ncbi:cyclase family protein [Corynebacterium pacaense]|uniref:cyclase family protein n=1 Tax=Corynebacterium pacaense TaxID=1816684 RepID=UPI0009BAD537|nr:cyclase family protein [Corynebacterium pacaense]
MRIIDLSHHFHPGQPHFPGDPDQRNDTVSTIREDGFLMHRYCFVGAWGTHVDAPAHFVDGGRTLEGIDPSDLLLPLVVVSFPGAGLIGAEDLRHHEGVHGRIPPRSFVALHTGWTWGAAGTAPGWSIPALELLDSRSVTAIGHDLPDTDPGLEAQHWWLDHDHWQVENMTNLGQVPAVGAHIVCAFPVPVGGVSFPVRPIAMIRET